MGGPIGEVIERTPVPSFRRGTDEQRLSRDTIFSVLSNERRRLVIRYLKQTDATVSLRDLAEQIACWENDVSQAEVTYKQRKRVYTSLHQSHLPKLQHSGIIEYDRDRGTIALSERANQLDIYLEIVPHDDVPWSAFYLGLAAVSTIGVCCAAVGIYPFSLLSGMGYAVLISGVLAIASLAHFTHSRRMRPDTVGDELPTDRSGAPCGDE